MRLKIHLDLLRRSMTVKQFAPKQTTMKTTSVSVSEYFDEIHFQKQSS